MEQRGFSDMMPWFVWFQPNKKMPTSKKAQEAIEEYQDRFGEDPTELLVNSVQLAEIGSFDGITVDGRNDVMRNHFYVRRA